MLATTIHFRYLSSSFVCLCIALAVPDITTSSEEKKHLSFAITDVVYPLYEHLHGLTSCAGKVLLSKQDGFSLILTHQLDIFVLLSLLHLHSSLEDCQLTIPQNADPVQ